MDVVSLSCHLSVFQSYFPLLVSVDLTPLHLSTIHFYYFPPPNMHSSLHLSCKFSPPSPSSPLLPAVGYFVSSLPPSPPAVSYPPFTLTPTGSQGASRLPPSDRLCWHHGSSILSKCRLGPCESFIFILSTLSRSLLLRSLCQPAPSQLSS